MRSGSVGAEAVSVRSRMVACELASAWFRRATQTLSVSETSISGNVDSAESSQASIAQTIPDGRWIVVCAERPTIPNVRQQHRSRRIVDGS